MTIIGVECDNGKVMRNQGGKTLLGSAVLISGHGCLANHPSDCRVICSRWPQDLGVGEKVPGAPSLQDQTLRP